MYIIEPLPDFLVGNLWNQQRLNPGQQFAHALFYAFIVFQKFGNEFAAAFLVRTEELLRPAIGILAGELLRIREHARAQGRQHRAKGNQQHKRDARLRLFE